MKLLHAALAGALLASPLPALAQSAAKAAPPAAAAPEAPALEPEAMAALNRMAAYLRTLKQYSVTVHSSAEDVMESGLKIMGQQRVDYVVQTPDKIYASVAGDNRKRIVYFDGKTFTVLSGDKNYYAQAPFVGTISQMLTAVSEKYGVNLPLEDLFRWGVPNSGVETPYAGFLVGSSQIGDWDTDHYVFRQQGVDFQVWIEKGDKPLPRKLVITSLDDPAQPEYVALLAWNLDAKIDPAQFTYVPDANAHKIPWMSEAKITGIPATAAAKK